MKQSFEERLERALGELPIAPEAGLAVAFSGGLDSTVLLEGLARALPLNRLRALHVDHGLHAQSASWEAHCRAAAERLGVPYDSVRVAVRVAPGASFEAPARTARYEALAAMMRAGEVLLTAHHADDQLETLLLRLLRGTGVRGLRGIETCAAFGVGQLARPLLGFTRAELRHQAERWNLRWLEDPANADPRYDRAHLRLDVLPRLRARWPAAPRMAARLARLMAGADEVLTAMAAHDASHLGDVCRVPLAQLLELPVERQSNLLRHLIGLAGLPVPSERQLEELRARLVIARRDAKTRVCWPGAEARVHRGRLYLLAPLAPASDPGCRARVAPGSPWTGPEGRVELVRARVGESGLPESWLRSGLEIRFRAGGERFRPCGAAHGRPLKRWLQEAGIVPWMRDRVPLLYSAGRLVAVGDLWTTADADDATEHEARWRVAWSGHPDIR